ncbi:MAG: hypothetical protein E6Q50_09195 [Lysobacter sp.]|nr:MAG: hypothetical protein E6Q50_09195 [Lysobacter sp.]
MDQPLSTGSSQEAYRVSLDPVVAQMSPHEREAFDWAVQGIPNVAALHAKYPNKSPREMIKARVSEVRSVYPKLLPELQAAEQKHAPIRKDLERITASSGQFSIEKNFFGLQPRIKAVVYNGSSRPISRLQWRASLYLNDGQTPVATTILTHDFRNDGGFKPKQSFTSTFTVGFIRGDETWTTLEVRNAKQRRVALEPILGSIRDFGDRLYLDDDPAESIKKLRQLHDIAEKYADI